MLIQKNRVWVFVVSCVCAFSLTQARADEGADLDELSGLDAPLPMVTGKLETPPETRALDQKELDAPESSAPQLSAQEADELDAPEMAPPASKTVAKKSVRSARKSVDEDLDGSGIDHAPIAASSGNQAPHTFSIEPKTRFTIANGTFSFQPSGGAAPYHFSILNGNATVDAQGVFKAGPELGTVTVRVEDGRGEKRDALVSIQPNLELRLAPVGSPGIQAGDHVFQVTGGAPPIRYSIDTKLNENGGKDEAGNDHGQAFLVVRDAAGEERRVSIQVERVPPLLAIAEQPEVSPDHDLQLHAIGGKAPYQFDVVSGEGKVDSVTGKYQAPKTETEPVVKVTDAEGQVQQIKFKVANSRAPASADESTILNSASTSGRMIAAGAGHTCLLDRGELSCWGQNRFGEVGDGTREQRIKPVKVPGFKGNIASVVAGYSHTCALTLGGRIYCWGDNRYGQLGDGTMDSSYVPMPVLMTRTAVMISSGQYHTCAVLDDGSASCWGSNRRGQLGNGGYTPSTHPLTVRDLGGKAREIAAGAGHTCALLQEGTVRCWGYNSSGQLGDRTFTDRPTPVAVKGLDGIPAESLTVGGFHSCIRVAQGARCWGANDMGQLGDGTTQKRSIPVVAKGVADSILGLSAGFYHTCALLASSPTVQCWGLNQSGQVGGDDELVRHLNPTAVQGVIPGALALGCGVDHSCVYGEDGLRCWGSNTQGQYGNRTLETSRRASAPVPMTSNPVSL